MENGPFTDDFPIKISIYNGFSMAMLNNQRVFIYIYMNLSILDVQPWILGSMDFGIFRG
jgi:hypothetical protein